jgi:hypothetical protein
MKSCTVGLFADAMFSQATTDLGNLHRMCKPVMKNIGFTGPNNLSYPI